MSVRAQAEEVRRLLGEVYDDLNGKFSKLSIEAGAFHYGEQLQNLAYLKDRMDEIIQALPGVQEGVTIEEARRLEQFEDWFTERIYECSSCLERDVLRDAKHALRGAWMNRKPQG